MMKIPRQIIIETSSACNLRCIGCPINSDSNPTGKMELPYFKSIIDRIDFPTTVIPWMNGEPLLNPNYAEMVKYVMGKKLPMYITTNGHFWNDELFEAITDPGSTCYQLIFSIDGLFDSASASMEIARPGTLRNRVIETVTRFEELKRRKNSKIDLAVKICRRGQDYGEIEEYISYWLDRGVDYVIVGRMLSEDNVGGMRRHPCRYFDDQFMVIRWDGRLVPCAYNKYVVNDGMLGMGRLDFSQPLLEAYNSREYRELRQMQNKGDFPWPCSHCGFAYTGVGFDGVVRFRDPKLLDKTIYYHDDYYNQMYSLVKKREGASFKGSLLKCQHCGNIIHAVLVKEETCPSCGKDM